MAQGNVSVNNLNLGQGPVTAIERYFLFIGPAPKNVGKLLALNTDSDLDIELGEAVSDLKTQISAARFNGGDRWACTAAPLAADGEWQAALDQAQDANVAVEAVIITKPVDAPAELEALHAAAIALGNRYGRRLFVMACSIGIAKDQEWSEYLIEQRALTANVAAPRVLLVPQLHGNDLGVLAGRLASAQVSIADSPMRVATGALVALGPVPTDSEGQALSSAVLSELDKARLSVPQSYADYPGMFWGDATLLDAPGSDFTVIENLRIVDKAARLIRILLIRLVADRTVNSTPNSMASTKLKLMRPLREMSRSASFAGLVFPGDIQPPKDGDITLVWKSRTAIEAYLMVRPYNCPKDLTANIALDLSLGDDE
ncbi:DUF2586 domain-containing protein [Pseudomonas sp. CCI4.2]|uniref:DUF2586 domain-containing protein n=1 Tax=Pseudomonas sp. CCI4.2 TaxID=3048620 RepID=UPI002AC96FD0|nr:DUF2586 domain-containing protein [Pseudomonas sp. CCI4.2]MEB0090065.1 DUF2586 domain-containing protein [Pseudomonas sp. CCI4.2]WPX53471.1 DUF2586 domain-containing protein [Pseudomonas sp. CCI4.2]